MERARLLRRAHSTGMSWNVMFCHEARSAFLAMCHEMSCSACAVLISCSRFRHEVRPPLNLPSTSPVRCRGHSRGAESGQQARISGIVFVRFLHVVPSSRSVHSTAGFPERRDPDSRVSCAGACARAGARIAAARFARLIARARRRTHFSCQLPGGFFAPARTGGRSGPANAAPFLSHHTIIR